MSSQSQENFNTQFNQLCSVKSNQNLSTIATHTEPIHIPMKKQQQQQRVQSLDDVSYATAVVLERLPATQQQQQQYWQTTPLTDSKSNTGSTWSI